MTQAEHDLLLLVAQWILDNDKSYGHDGIAKRNELRVAIRNAQNEDDIIYEGRNKS